MKLLWFHPRALLPPQGGGDLRTLGLLNEVVAAGHEVLMVTAGTPRTISDGFDIAPLRLRSGMFGGLAKVFSRFPLRSPRPSLDSIVEVRRRIAEFAPEVALVSEVMTESLAEPLIPDVPWIYDAHNVEHVLFAQMAAQSMGAYDRITFAVDRRRVSRTERALVRGADAVITVSDEDAAGLAALGPRRAPTVVHSSVPTPARPAAPAEVGKAVLFVGTLDYPPNAAAVSELVEQIMPTVREAVPEARLMVVGRKAAPELRALLQNLDWIDFYEDAPDVAPYYAAARCVALPIRFGGGSRLKVSEALAWGLPAVGTEAAFAGLPIPADVVLRAQTVPEMAAGVIKVLTDDDLAVALGSAAREHFVSVLALPVVTRPLLKLLEQLA